jgi:predicted nucleic acid-binding protein
LLTPDSLLGAGLASSGKRIGSYDFVVAATAMENGMDMATFNKRHLPRKGN